jgi:hypothetical protein
MKKTTLLLASALALSSMSASAAVLVAGWETFSGSTGFAPTQTGLGTTADIVATATTGSWDQWNNANGSGLGQGASTDGTFGAFVGATANTNNAAAGNGVDNLALGNSDGVLVLTLTNNSGSDQLMDGFHFDAVTKNANGADTWALAFGGAISGTTVTQTISGAANMSGASAAARDRSIDLTTLTDSVWEAGQDITFTWTFTGTTNSGGSNGNELLLDNIGVSVISIPEPSSALLLGLGALGLFGRRRR